MSVCCVCKKRRITGSDIVFHSFPLDKKLAQQWCQLIGLDRLPVPSSKVCGEHFIDKDYVTYDGQTKMKTLVFGAIPSRNLPELATKNRNAKHAESVTSKKTRTIADIPSYLLEIESILNIHADPQSIKYYHDEDLQTVTIDYQTKPEPMLTEEKSVVCSSCHAIYKNESDLNLHRKICLEKLKPYQCASCLVSYDTVKALRGHRCSQDHSNIAEIKEKKSKFHRQSMDPNEQESSFKLSSIEREQMEYLTLAVSGKEYDSDSDDDDRSEEGHPNKACLECDRFISVNKMQLHFQKFHQGKKPPFRCRLCDRSFVSCLELCKHLKSHSFAQLRRLLEQNPNGMRYLNGNRECFECFLCGNAFNTKESVRTHQHSHLRDILRCPICKCVVAARKDFVVHLKKHQ